MSSHTQEELPSTSLDGSIIEFEFETNHNLCFGMSDTHLNLKLHFFKERLIDAFIKEKFKHNAKSEDDSDE